LGTGGDPYSRSLDCTVSCIQGTRGDPVVLTVAHLDPAGWTLASRHVRIVYTGRSLDVCSLTVTHAYWARGAVLAVVHLHRDLSWIQPSSSNLDGLFVILSRLSVLVLIRLTAL
jgi:hypothetical protein